MADLAYSRRRPAPAAACRRQFERDESLITATAPDEIPEIDVWWWGDTVAVVAVVAGSIALAAAGFTWLALNGSGAL